MIPKLGQKFFLLKDINTKDYSKTGTYQFESVCFGTYDLTSSPKDIGIYYVEEYFAPSFSATVTQSSLKQKINTKVIDDLLRANKQYSTKHTSLNEAELQNMCGLYYRFCANIQIESYIVSIDGFTVNTNTISVGSTVCGMCKNDCQYAVSRPNFVCWSCLHGPYAGLKI